MKKVFLLSLLVLGLSCNDTDDVFKEVFNKGAYIEFANEPEFNSISITKFSEFIFSEEIIDPNNNATLYQLDLSYKNDVIENFVTVETFPSTLTFTGQQILDALNITNLELDISSPINFTAKITTPDGVFIGKQSDFNFDNNTQNGGTFGSNVFGTSRSPALEFSLSVFLPDVIKLRGTSFEEPFGNDQPYNKPGGPTDGDELSNNPGERSVQYTAIGNGVDNEIGFKTFVKFALDNAGWTSEKIGVSSEDAILASGFADGSQAYELEDTDGSLLVVFDKVEVDNSINKISGVEIKYYIARSGYEPTDFIKITAEIEGADGSQEEMVLLDVNGTDIENTGIEEQWLTASTGLLENVVSYKLTLEADTSVNGETFYFDDMKVFTIE
jgi:hypothetical protein